MMLMVIAVAVIILRLMCVMILASMLVQVNDYDPADHAGGN